MYYLKICIIMIFFCLNLIFPDEFLLVIRQKLSQTQYLLLKECINEAFMNECEKPFQFSTYKPSYSH